MNNLRREFLKFMGYSSLGLFAASELIGCSSSPNKSLEGFPFQPILPCSEDDLRLAKGFSYKRLISWGDKINSAGQQFGFNNDYTAFLPLASKDDDKDEAILWVNHESHNPVFVGGYKGSDGKGKTKEQLLAERRSVGGSILKISKKTNSEDWTFVSDDKLNRRIDGQTKIPFFPKQKIKGKNHAIGTLSNCAGGVTPWSTILTCEENYQDYYGETFYNGETPYHESKNKKLSWEYIDPLPPEHYGWVVEVNPRNGDCKKLVGLGRFSHECATTIQDKESGRAVVYMGDDANDQCIYKFISDKPGSLARGSLFVANTEQGKWLELSWEKNKKLKSKFKNQQEVLIRCREAALLIGGTPQNRPEDVEINPITGDIYVALTNNKPKGNFHGSLLKISETHSNHLSKTFVASDFLLGGEKSGFSCPDNLVFDKKGNIWLTTDISGKNLGKAPYQNFKNNGLFYIPLNGKFAGQALQVASAPAEAEFTGLSFSNNYKTLFLSVQHPGENTTSLDNLHSHWPLNDNKSIPKPSVVTIKGHALDQLMA